MISRSSSRTITFPKGCSLGGYGPGYQSISTGDLEVNTVELCASIGFSLTSIDTLYPGQLVDSFPSHLICATHTHYSPMIDSKKPLVGDYDPAALEKWEKAIENMLHTSFSVRIKRVLEYRATVDHTIYRRFDSQGNSFERYSNPFIGMFPNKVETVDQTIRIFVFFDDASQASYCLVWHCCHPVSRSRRDVISSDYVGIIRTSLRERFGDIPVLFLLGPSGDIRPNLTEKRIPYLPDIFPNRKFSAFPTGDVSSHFETGYQIALNSMHEVKSVISPGVTVEPITLKISNGDRFESFRLKIAGLVSFIFYPFEVSHRYHWESELNGELIVSCAGSVNGYLPHKSQLTYGGYEVDSSRVAMGYGSERFYLEDVL